MFKRCQSLRFSNENESVLTRVLAAGIQVFYCRFISTEQVECDPNKETDSDVRQGTHFKLSYFTLAGCRGGGYVVVSVAGIKILQRECVFTRVLAAGIQVHCQSEI